MATEVLMPKLGAQMEEGTVVSWLVDVGEEVEDGDPLVEIQTDKITMEIEAEVDGVLLKTLYDESAVVPVQKVIAYIGEEGENVKNLAEEDTQEEVTVDTKPEQTPAVSKGDTSVPSINKIRRTPAARKLGEDQNVELSNIDGSGPLGRIHKKDVEAYLGSNSKKATPLAKKVAVDQGIEINDIQGTGSRGKVMKDDILAEIQEDTDSGIDQEGKRIPYKGMRKVIGDRISESAYTSPHVTLLSEIDMTNVVELRKQLLPVIEETEGLRISFNDILIKATAFALKQHPGINIQLDGDEIVYNSSINIGMAVAVPEGLVVPVLRNADQKGLAAITKEAKGIGRKARDGKLSHEDMQGSTFTISNLGMYAVDGFTPIINSPNAAILGVGRIEKKPAVVDEQVIIRSMMNLSLSFDHRIVDGAPAAAFLTELKDVLENPYKLMV
ncbi:dihydrolipoamide acetyltransferase family protein [Virgibacillus ainsalahensis]